MKTGRTLHLLFATFVLLQGVLFRPASHAQDLRDYQKSFALNSLVSEVNDRVRNGWNGRQLAELQQDLAKLEAVRSEVDQHKFPPWKASAKLTLAGLYIQLARISQSSCMAYLNQAAFVVKDVNDIGAQIELKRAIKLDTHYTKANWSVTAYLCDSTAAKAATFARSSYDEMLAMPSLSEWPGRRGLIQLEIAVLMHLQAPWIRGVILNSPKDPAPPAPNRQEERARLDGILKQIALAEPDMSRPGAAADDACTLKRERGNIIVWAVTGSPLADDPEVTGPMLEKALADLRDSRACSRNRSSIRTPYVPSAIADALVFRAMKTGSVADATEALNILLGVEERVIAGEQELIADQRSKPAHLASNLAEAVMIVARASTDVTTLARMEEIHRRQMPRLLGCRDDLTPCSRSQLAQAELLYRLGVATKNPDKLREAITSAEKLMPDHGRPRSSVTAMEVATLINDASKALAKVGGPRIRQAEIDNRLGAARRWDEQSDDQENGLDLERRLSACISAGQSKERSACVNDYAALARKHAEATLADHLARQDGKVMELFLYMAWAEMDAGMKAREPAYLEAGRTRLTLLKAALPQFKPKTGSSEVKFEENMKKTDELLDTWILMISGQEAALRTKSNEPAK